MKKFITNKYVLTILGCILFLVIWISISAIVNDTKMIFPDPLSTVQESFRILSTSYVYHCLAWTMYRMLIGFSISFVAALLFGVFAGHFSWLKTMLKPIIIALKSVPTAALIFLCQNSSCSWHESISKLIASPSASPFGTALPT